jgi:hypothetical protein
MGKRIGFAVNKKFKIITAAIILTVLVCILTFRAGVAVGAADSEAGSISDPLVSKSYLDSRLNSLSGVMTKVTVPQNSTLTASEGAMVLVYSGNGSVSGSGAGLVNVTAGEMTQSGLSVAKYNTYLFPDEATGITATSNMVVFVTGTYSISQ